MTKHTNVSEVGDILNSMVPGFDGARVEDPVVTVQVPLSTLRALVGEAKVAEFMYGGVRPFKLVRSTAVKATWPLAPKTMWTLEAL